MKNTYLRVKGIIKKGDTYLLLKRWVDDRSPEPFIWEFIDAEVPHGDSPDETMKSAITELLSVNAKIEKIEYTWSQLLGETHCVGIAYICSIPEDEESHIVLTEDYGSYEWVTREQIPLYIDNQYVLADLEGKEL